MEAPWTDMEEYKVNADSERALNKSLQSSGARFPGFGVCVDVSIHKIDFLPACRQR